MPFVAAFSVVAQDDIARIKARLAEHYAPIAARASGLSSAELLSGLDHDGRWPDLEAAFTPDEVGYARFGHFLRLQQIAGACHSESDPAMRQQWAAATHRALGVWLDREAPASPNWQKQIGSPKALAKTAMLFDEELTDAERNGIITILKTCVRPDGTLDYSGEPATGANLLDEAETQIVAGCLLRDEAMVARYAQVAEHELKPGRGEGIQVDGSFHQHGPQLYSGGYGAGLACDAAALAWTLRETPFAFSSVSVESLRRYVLDGTQHMTRGRALDFTTVGRQISRPDLGGPADWLASALASLQPLAGGRGAELQSFADRLRGTASPTGAPTGTTVFWNSDYVTHSRPGFFASARMSSRRTEGYECGNGENELGYHLGDGAMTLMVTGEEYRDIFPLWDWQRVPGVSCVIHPNVPFPRHLWGRGAEGFSDFAGGVGDGRTGAAAMELHRGGLHARKAWFFLENAVLCLGADLLPDDPALQMLTSIDQRWACGPVTSSFDPGPLAKGETFARTGPGWVHHDGVTYLFPTGAPLRMLVEHKTASWSAINHATNNRATGDPAAPAAPVEGDVFSLWLDHGANVYHGASYAYAVAPGLEPAAIPQFATPQILANTPDLQAINEADLVQAVFWKPGQLALPDGRFLEVNRPCLAQARHNTTTPRWTVAIGNPTQQPGPVRVRLGLPDASAKELVFDFPAGAFAGQPMLQTLP